MDEFGVSCELKKKVITGPTRSVAARRAGLEVNLSLARFLS